MCQCGTKKPTLPAKKNGDSPAAAAVKVCPGFQSAILVIDEIGLPMKSTTVTVILGGGAPQDLTTDDEGRVCFHEPPGTAAVVKLAETHEAKEGQSTKTPSGQHFGHYKPGP